MVHTRIRKGNTKSGILLPAVDYCSSQAVIADDQIFLLGQTGLTIDGETFVGKGNVEEQAENAMSNVKILLEESGSSINDICKIVVYTTDISYRNQVYPVIAKYLKDVNPVSTGIVVKSLAKPYIDFEIDVWAVIPKNKDIGHLRLMSCNSKNGYLMPNLDFGNSRVIKANENIFLQGQTGLTLDGKNFIGKGDLEKQTDQAMKNIQELLCKIGSNLEDICKMTVYIKDLKYRQTVYRVISEYLKNIHPVSTGVVIKGLASDDLDVEIDVFAHSQKVKNRYFQSKPNYLSDIDFPLSKIVKSGKSIFLQGQTGLSLNNNKLIGENNPGLQAETAMNNVKILLESIGASLGDICKIITYVSDLKTRDLVYPVIAKYIKDVYPTSTGLVVESLSNSELEFEIDVFAVLK